MNTSCSLSRGNRSPIFNVVPEHRMHRHNDSLDSWIEPEDTRILWFVQTYRDLPKLRRTLARLRTLYPHSDVLVVSDGDPNPQIEDACRQFRARYTLRPRLFCVEYGGESVHQMLEAFAATDADVVIKIDPDTNIRRRFSLMPRPDGFLYLRHGPVVGDRH